MDILSGGPGCSAGNFLAGLRRYGVEFQGEEIGNIVGVDAEFSPFAVEGFLAVQGIVGKSDESFYLYPYVAVQHETVVKML